MQLPSCTQVNDKHIDEVNITGIIYLFNVDAGWGYFLFRLYANHITQVFELLYDNALKNIDIINNRPCKDYNSRCAWFVVDNKLCIHIKTFASKLERQIKRLLFEV